MSKNPIKRNTDPSTYIGTSWITFPRKRQGRKQIAVTMAVIPVFPPASIPAMLSKYGVPEEEPKSGAKREAKASTIRPCFIARGLPVSSSKFVLCATPTKVSRESKKSVKKSDRIIGKKDNFHAPQISNLKNTSVKFGKANQEDGFVNSPKKAERTVPAIIPIR